MFVSAVVCACSPVRVSVCLCGGLSVFAVGFWSCVCAFVFVVASVVLWFLVRASGREFVRGGLHSAPKNGRNVVTQKWTQK